MFNSPLRQRAIEVARRVCSSQPVYMDTETTGLDYHDEIVEISIIDDSGAVLLETLVKPSRPIPFSATQIHGITDQDVLSAHAWPVVWPLVRAALYGRMVVLYNQEFDLRMMQQSHARYRLPWKDRFNTIDLMKLYAEFMGSWDNRRRSYRYFSLAQAGQLSKIALPNAHRATADTLLTRALLHFIADSE